ncbi:MAG: hypothetical protein H0U72_04310 [Nitrosospira sp.]|nr:hypothetical protein [Nitrosospira sp.]
MFEDIGSLMPSPKELVVGAIIAIFVHVIVGLLNLMYGKSKSAVLTFTKERSEKQKAARRLRVEVMRREEKWFHYYLASMNTKYIVMLMFQILSMTCLLVITIAVHTNNVDSSILVMLVVGPVSQMVSIYYMFEGAAIQQDLARSFHSMEPPGDDDRAPL